MNKHMKKTPNPCDKTNRLWGSTCYTLPTYICVVKIWRYDLEHVESTVLALKTEKNRTDAGACVPWPCNVLFLFEKI